MKKRLLLTIALSGLSLKSFSQSNGFFEQDYYWGGNRPFSWVPVAGYCTAGNWYFEARGNYEAINTGSLYLGKAFRKKALLSYSITPIAGVVMGGFNGGSVGANVVLDYKKISFSSQSQYTFSIKNPAANFTYSWSDLTYQLNGWMAAGVSLQQTRGLFEKGILIKGIYKNLSAPLYVFNPATSKRYFVLGLNAEWGR
ncbi:hypothetical protein [Mucilaginibacter flavidus]|uniref:hypothetical protein n=1 Tax=Mucilaginibacter flavidus TaxID=2949309 RepID=UPI002093B8DE|nr:hypothetical protein [Mucilaginibacter flavidus]MCO5949472.1 hypothetical protein [Mucilaginibacter flavidus]